MRLNNILAEGSKHQPLHIKALYTICGCLMLGILITLLVLYKKLKAKRGRIMVPPGVKETKEIEIKDNIDMGSQYSTDSYSSNNETEGIEQKLSDVDENVRSEKNLVNSYCKKKH